jgi:hypothetical protein
MNEGLGLDHFEGRSWQALHSHTAHDHDRLRVPSAAASQAGATAKKNRSWATATNSPGAANRRSCQAGSPNDVATAACASGFNGNRSAKVALVSAVFSDKLAHISPPRPCGRVRRIVARPSKSMRRPGRPRTELRISRHIYAILRTNMDDGMAVPVAIERSRRRYLR